jgi:peptide deformylase
MEVVIIGNEVLRQKCKPVEKVTEELVKITEQMFELMESKDGVGLAAPQVGIPERFFVVESDDNIRRVFINPQIIKTSQETGPYDEGCLSIPGEYETIIRPTSVTVQALNEKGRPFTLEADGLLARIIQHEYDHLEGILYIDRGDQFTKFKIEEKFKHRAEKRLAKEKAKAEKAMKIAAKKAAKAQRNS